MWYSVNLHGPGIEIVSSIYKILLINSWTRWKPMNLKNSCKNRWVFRNTSILKPTNVGNMHDIMLKLNENLPHRTLTCAVHILCNSVFTQFAYSICMFVSRKRQNYRYMFLKNKIVLKINAMWIILLICMPRTLGAGVLHAYEIVRSCVQFCVMSIPTDIFIN